MGEEDFVGRVLVLVIVMKGEWIRTGLLLWMHLRLLAVLFLSGNNGAWFSWMMLVLMDGVWFSRMVHKMLNVILCFGVYFRSHGLIIGFTIPGWRFTALEFGLS
jgi:hypothetical protein